MTYIALLIAVLVGGYTAYQHYLPGAATDPAVSEVGILDPLDAARGAVAQMEKRSDTDFVGAGKNVEVTKTEIVAPEKSQTNSAVSRPEKMLVAGGCFWCVEADLEKLPGVIAVVSGYAGGNVPNPNYENYSKNGHREVVEVTYDANRVTFEQILIYAMKHMDPTDDDGSFGDRGEYYSPAFYYGNAAEKAKIENLIADVDKNGPYKKPLGIDVEADSTFYRAEDYHQDYYKGTLSKIKYQYYRNASGRDKFIAASWGADTGATLPWRTVANPVAEVITNPVNQSNSIVMWKNYIKPSKAELKTSMEAVAFNVTQEDGTERARTSPLDKNYEAGIYVDVLSGEPLFSSKDKFDSGTGWPSFVKPIEGGAITEHEDNTFFSKRTEVRSKIADNHLGHVFTDGPADRGGLRYCMNGVALRFIPESDLEASGYGEFKASL